MSNRGTSSIADRSAAIGVFPERSIQTKLSLWLAKACGNRPDRVEKRTMVMRKSGGVARLYPACSAQAESSAHGIVIRISPWVSSTRLPRIAKEISNSKLPTQKHRRSLNGAWQREASVLEAEELEKWEHSLSIRPFRAACAAADEVRNCDQSQDHEGARSRHAALVVCPCRRGD